MSCNGICDRYRAERPPQGIGRYASGQKRCQMCGIYMVFEGTRCPCCNITLRTRPRNIRHKRKFYEDTEQELSFEHTSWISRVFYRPKTRRMVILCRDNENQYELEDIDRSQYEEFKNAPSRGKYYNQNFKGIARHKSRWFR